MNFSNWNSRPRWPKKLEREDNGARDGGEESGVSEVCQMAKKRRKVKAGGGGLGAGGRAGGLRAGQSLGGEAGGASENQERAVRLVNGLLSRKGGEDESGTDLKPLRQVAVVRGLGTNQLMRFVQRPVA